MAGNMQISIYHIDKRSVEEEIKAKETENEENKKEEKEYSTEYIVDFLLKENSDYRLQELREEINIDIKGFKTKIAYKPTPPTDTTWKNFFLEILDKDSAMLKSKKQEESFMVYIYNENNIYSITGGFAFHRIESYLDSLFGIKILSGLINRNSKTIKGVSERNVSKSIMATTKMFRVDYSISQDEDFGKIYKEIVAQLDSKILEEKLGFKKDEIKKVQCIAKTYFKITKSINIEKVYEIIEKIDNIMSQDIEDLNKVCILNTRNKKDKYMIKNLENILMDKLYKDYVGTEEFYYDICDNDYQNFLLSGNYALQYNNYIVQLPCYEKEDVLKGISAIAIDKKINLNVKDNFERLIQNIKILSFDEDVEHESTNSKLIRSISAEVEKDGNKYFIMEGTWFKITENYISDLNKKLKESIGGRVNTELITNKWNKKTIIDRKTEEPKEVYITETEFMENNFLKEKDVIITHTKLIDNIEFADLIKIDNINRKVYLIHIKRGFDASVRDLSYQMMFSYNILQSVKLQGNYEKIERLYDELEQNEKDKITKEDFVKLFKNDEVVYVFTFNDETSKNRKIKENLEQFESNIAKGVLLDLIKFYNIENMNLEIAQIDVVQ